MTRLIAFPQWTTNRCDAEPRSWLTRTADWFVDARAHRVVCVVAAIWVLNAFDLTLTICANQIGVLYEQNPLAVRFLREGTLSIALFKLGLVLLGSYPLLRFRSARITELGALVVLSVYALLAIRWTACYELYTLSVNSGIYFAEAL